MFPSNIETIVVKVGSSLLVEENSGHIKTDFLYDLIKEIAYLRAAGIKVVLVSSGSVAIGRRYCNVPLTKKLDLAEKQAAAALGQPDLMSAYQYLANEHSFRMPQVLITLQDFEDRQRFLNAEDTFEALLKQGSVPIVNENDTVATEHLRIGDNDRLAAKVAQLVEADTLVILTNVDGLYDENMQIIQTINELNEDIFSLAGGAKGPGSGGMITKLQAAEISAASGCTTILTSGHSKTPIQNALDDNHLHTTIRSNTTPKNARKLWISTSLDIQGELHVKPSMISKLEKGLPILPQDIEKVEGDFSRGDIVSIKCQNEEVARGLTSFYMYEVTALIENQSLSVFDVLGYDTKAAIIDKNDLALLGQ